MKQKKILISSTFKPLIEDRNKFLVMGGGAGSGKSVFASFKACHRCATEGGHVGLVIRKVGKTLKKSVWREIKNRLYEMGIKFKQNKTEMIISFGDNEIHFIGVDDIEKVKSISGITWIWIEEATELNEEEFDQLVLRLRPVGVNYIQIMMTFNPVLSRGRWIKKRFFDKTSIDDEGNPNATVHMSTVDDNPSSEFVKIYRKVLDAIKDGCFKQIYRYGKWSAPEGQILSHVKEIPLSQYPTSFDWVGYGLDFGFNNPQALIMVGIKDRVLYLHESIYKSGLKDNEFVEMMVANGTFAKCETGNIDASPIYCDSENPEKIEELKDKKLFALPAKKGPGSVFAGLMLLKNLEIYTHPGNKNLNEEISSYAWKQDKDGNFTDVPDKDAGFDHGIDAVRYCAFSHYHRLINSKGFFYKVER